MYEWWWDVYGAFVLWLTFMAVVVVYALRIGLLLREQRLAERAYRMRLARSMGRAVREQSAMSDRG